ncbi:hypothetical protein TNCT_468121 [Trichonephila clavata]|uniref:Uncharacterized protein n=1 Tax=Trichonephila clavata TaxID=2740835 RepID=A0A8X6FZN1_TRICU|nr:hypothetical protein TNCT_468121 [Trichonephila clavata]
MHTLISSLPIGMFHLCLTNYQTTAKKKKKETRTEPIVTLTSTTHRRNMKRFSSHFARNLVNLIGFPDCTFLAEKTASIEKEQTEMN